MTSPAGPFQKRPQRIGPLEAAWRNIAYALDRLLKTGRRRSEFEAKYRGAGDYFGYLTSPYEKLKYERSLEAVLAWRKGAGSVLEIGCSVGVFTAMIADRFDAVVAVDIAQEALALAADHVGDKPHVTYVRSDLASLDLGRTFDVILCAEILMYVPAREADAVCSILERHLAPDGRIIEVSQQDRAAGAPKFFHGWDEILGRHFRIVERLRFDDAQRPYEIVAYERR